MVLNAKISTQKTIFCDFAWNTLAKMTVYQSFWAYNLTILWWNLFWKMNPENARSKVAQSFARIRQKKLFYYLYLFISMCLKQYKGINDNLLSRQIHLSCNCIRCNSLRKLKILTFQYLVGPLHASKRVLFESIYSKMVISIWIEKKSLLLTELWSSECSTLGTFGRVLGYLKRRFRHSTFDQYIYFWCSLKWYHYEGNLFRGHYVHSTFE